MHVHVFVVVCARERGECVWYSIFESLVMCFFVNYTLIKASTKSVINIMMYCRSEASVLYLQFRWYFFADSLFSFLGDSTS